MSGTRLTRGGQGGQILAPLAIVLALVPFGLLSLAIVQERTAYAALERLVQAAALDGTGVLSDASLATAAPTLAGGSASCTAQDATATMGADAPATGAARQACRTLARGLAQAFPGPRARVDTDQALAATQVEVLNGTPDTPAQDPASGQSYHYPTVCVLSHIRVGVMESDGIGLTFSFHACAQAAWPV